MREQILETELWVPRGIGEVFAFFADARNLQAITPAWLHFRILTAGKIDMRAGALIEYRIRLRGIPIGWRTRIAEWRPPYRFVDEQVMGPYRKWHHTHTFESKHGGTLCRDRVVYASPGGPLVHAWFVRPEVERIFRFRQETLAGLFGIRTEGVGAFTDRIEAAGA